MVKANVDKILDVLNERKSASVGELSSLLRIKSDDIQKSAEYLEQDGVIKIERKWPKVVLTLIKKQPSAEMPPPPPVVRTQIDMPQPERPKMMPPQQPVASQQPQNYIPQQAGIGQPGQQPVQQAMPQATGMAQPAAAQPVIQQTPLSAQVKNPETPPALNIPASQDIPVPPFHGFESEQPFLISDSEEPSFLTPPKEVERDSSTNLIDEDPLNQAPRFEMSVPSPAFERARPIFSYTQEFSADIEEKYPEYITAPGEKIDYMLEKIQAKINRADYKDLNILYRKLHDIYQNSDSLSTNERYIFGEKIQEMFESIKNIYLVERPV